jgi:hypothetical protein
VTTDFRQVLTEVLTNRAGISDVSGIFPSLQTTAPIGFYSV